MPFAAAAILKDIQQHYAGWLFYRETQLGFLLRDERSTHLRASAWRIPIPSHCWRRCCGRWPMRWAERSSILAGYPYLLCTAGRVRCAAMRAVLRGVPACAAGSLLFSASPILIERAFRHTSLGAQWLVLAALSLLFLRATAGRYRLPLLFAVNMLAVGIHPIFCP